MTFPYFSPESEVISVPFSHLSARRPLISVLAYFSSHPSLACLLNIFHKVKGEALTSYHTSFYSVRKLPLFQYSRQLVFAVSRLLHVLFCIFSVFLLIIYYLKKLFYASIFHILNPSCHLVGSVETSVISLVLTSSGNYICHQGSTTLLHLWKILHLVRDSSVFWSLCLLIHL